MITVSDQELSQVEYLIQQSKLGNHILFEADTIRRVFKQVALKENQKDFQKHIQEEDAYSVEHHIEKLISQPSLRQKRAYLESLDSRTHDLVVLTYFNIVENNIFEASGVRH